MGSWIISEVESLENVFNPYRADNNDNFTSALLSFNEDVSQWVRIDPQVGIINSSPLQDVSAVTNMAKVFKNSPFNGDISQWNTGRVVTLFEAFRDARSFDRDISNWDVSQVTSLFRTFRSAVAFNQPLNSWNLGNARSLGSAFYNAQSFNQDLASWDTASVTNMFYVFYNAKAFNGDVSSK